MTRINLASAQRITVTLYPPYPVHDYVGEPGAWPHVSSSFGAIDLSGFHKAGAAWFRTVWLANISADDAGRPPLPASSTTVHIVESWRAPLTGTTRTIHVYTNAPFARLLVGSTPLPAVPVGFFSFATFSDVAYAPGTLTAQALAADGTTVLATHTRASYGAPAAVVLSLDAPSLATGTGAAVYLDGGDVALVRATIVDASGNVVSDSSLNVTFAVTAGPGRIWGVGNGDPACQEPTHATWRSAYHGLARAVVRVTLLATGSPSDRALVSAVNADAGKSAESSTVLAGGATPPTALTVTATVPGLASGSVTIALSVDPADAVLAVAARSVGVADMSAA